MDPLKAAIDLARFLGDPDQDTAILAEGNVSAIAEEGSFWVKASGFEMASISADGFVRVGLGPVLSALEGEKTPDQEVKRILTVASFGTERAPSVETFMHAYLLSLPGVKFVGHGHPAPLLSLLCLQSAEHLAKQRLFPDEVVCCGPAAAFVPYADPGLPLARAIRGSVEAYVANHGAIPRTIWMANHGLIALGETPAEVRNAFAMSVKAARVWLGALGTGKRLRTLTAREIERIHTRPDEHYRQALLRQMGTSHRGETATIAPHG